MASYVFGLWTIHPWFIWVLNYYKIWIISSKKQTCLYGGITGCNQHHGVISRENQRKLTCHNGNGFLSKDYSDTQCSYSIIKNSEWILDTQGKNYYHCRVFFSCNWLSISQKTALCCSNMQSACLNSRVLVITYTIAILRIACKQIPNLQMSC